MANNESSMCAGLPRWLWWLLTLVGLGLLYFFMLSARQGPIESDLTERTHARFGEENIDWATANLQGRGRDVLLTGAAPSEETRDHAADIARNLRGVRVVDNQLTIAAPLSSSHLAVQETNGTVTLRGELASQASIDEVVAAAKSAYGNDNVVNELKLSDQVKKARWLSGAVGMLTGMAGMGAANLKISDAGSHLTGEVASGEAKASVLDSAKRLLGDGAGAEIVVVAAPEPEPAPEPVVAAGPSALELCQSKLDGAMVNKKILFAYDKADVSTASYGLLDEISSVLKECKDIVTAHGLTISGHTDSRGDDAYNKALSQSRADTVTNYLVKAGVDAGLIQSIGHGESQPAASNDTEEGMAQNRRITFTIKHQ